MVVLLSIFRRTTKQGEPQKETYPNLRVCVSLGTVVQSKSTYPLVTIDPLVAWTVEIEIDPILVQERVPIYLAPRSQSLLFGNCLGFWRWSIKQASWGVLDLVGCLDLKSFVGRWCATAWCKNNISTLWFPLLVPF